MSTHRKCRDRAEFGDFQTPPVLAREVCSLLAHQGVRPASILEPTCGEGNFLLASLEQFPTAQRGLAADIKQDYVAKARSRLQLLPESKKVRVFQADFFSTDWPSILAGLDDPVLVIGNPPWVTNSELGTLRSSNLPTKSNFQNHSGIDAITGKSNFDISEWMLIRTLELLKGRSATLAMLCKMAVARRVLLHCWRNSIQISKADIYPVDAMQYFDAAVRACLLKCAMTPSGASAECSVRRSIRDDTVETLFGVRDARIVANLSAYERWKHLLTQVETYRWRSGIKHDSSKVMEFREEGNLYRNGLGELVELEDAYLYPMFKSSELGNGHCAKPNRWMLVTQRIIGEKTTTIRHLAPKTWHYLLGHSRFLEGRASSIYKNRPRFSIFGVGEYSFSPWKVAISGFYKKLSFKVIGPFRGKPVVFDDTCYFLPFGSEAEARYIASLLNSEQANAFYNSLVFWDAKRPITNELLRQLDLLALSQELGSEKVLRGFLSEHNSGPHHPEARRLSLFG